MEKLVNKALDDLRDRVYGSEYEQFTNLVKGIVHEEIVKQFKIGGTPKIQVGHEVDVKDRDEYGKKVRNIGEIDRKKILPHKNRYDVSALEVGGDGRETNVQYSGLKRKDFKHYGSI